MLLAVGEVVRARGLFLTLIERQLKLRAKRSWMGTAWPVAAPFVLAAVYVFVFQRVLRVPIPRYDVFLLCGLIPWVFLVQSLGRGIQSVTSEPEIVRQARFPYALLPLSTTAAYASNLLIGLGLFVGYLATQGEITWRVLPALVVPLACLVLVVMSLTMLVALIDVYQRDLRHLLPQVMIIWFFLVPIVYRPSMVPPTAHALQSIEPMNAIVAAFREILYAGRLPSLDTTARMGILSIGAFLLSSVVFNRASDHLAENV